MSCMIAFRSNVTVNMSINMDVSTDKGELDHRLHFHIATEHFTHDNERIKLHFKVDQSR
jgi:hypothetical protein